MAQDDKLRIRKAMTMTAIMIGLAAAFAVGMFFVKGRQSAMEFVAGYLVEQSLSVDNLFVFLMLFSYFRRASHPSSPRACRSSVRGRCCSRRVPLEHQDKILTWGIIGAVAMVRGALPSPSSPLILNMCSIPLGRKAWGDDHPRGSSGAALSVDDFNLRLDPLRERGEALLRG